MRRREFIKKTAVGTTAYAGASLAGFAMPMPAHAYGGGVDVEEGLYYVDDDRAKKRNVIPAIRPEILNEPRAVFLVETHVQSSRDAKGNFMDARPELEDIGKKLISQVFVKGTKKGGKTFILPNFTTVPEKVASPVVGIITSPDFIAGFVEGMREIGNTNIIAGARGTSVDNHRTTGIYEIFDKHRIKLIEANYPRFALYRKEELNWNKVPGEKMVWNKIPSYRPIGDKDCFFINMPKLKNHNLGLTTLSIKNLQGAVPSGYGHYCNRWAMMELLVKRSYNIDFKNFEKHYYENVEAAFLKHVSQGTEHWEEAIKSYDQYQKKGGWEAFKKVKGNSDDLKEFMSGIDGPMMWDEQWSQRAVDSAKAIVPTINIIEGVIGRDGSGFDTGTDQLSNVIVVGLSIAEVDAVGSYIMGHDPKKLPYTRVAKERGLGENDPSKIKIYWIRQNGTIEPLKNLSEIKRTPLGVNYHTWSETGERLFW